MKKIILSTLLFLSTSLSAGEFRTFNIDESNSENKYSLLKIEPVDNYFRFNIDVMQKNKWAFRTDIELESDNLNRQVKAHFRGNTITFTLTEEEYLDLLNSERLFIKTHINYQDSFYMPNFRNTESYKRLAIEEFKSEYIEKK